MYNIKVKDIVKATGGRLLCGDENVEINDVCTNSKLIKPGDLFVPIIGAKVDAHRFIESALEVGAATLTSHHSGLVLADKPYIQVHDTQKALQDIARYIRKDIHIPMIGVTGSVGKTTTREMIATALGQNIRVFQTEGNKNSQIGVPITISQIDPKAEMAVLEMGMSNYGQMAILSDLVKPDICVITVIGVAHIEYLKTRENIRNEKLSIVNSMNRNGILFLNGDDEMLAEIKDKTGVKTVCYGTKEWCEYRAENIHMENYKIAYDYVHGDKRVPVLLNALGKHNVGNSLVGMAISDYMGLDLEKAAAGFATFEGLRQKLIEVPGKYTIIDDTYNASPDSMKASIDVLSDLEAKGKKIAVLGDMFELGEDSELYHYEVGKYLADKNIDELVVVGELSQHIMKAVKDTNSPIRCFSFKDNGEVTLYLLSVMSSDDIVLIKGSNGMNLSSIVSNMRG
ncbi:MAG: UDP-N-acetylmuramoyl-tripeptide--D-alanyl-D-alanine ligase [Wujia sp.]